MDYQQNTGSNRPFSTTNPFRTAGLGEQSPQPGHYNSTWNSFDSQPVPEQIPLYSSNNPVSFNDSVNPPRPTMARRKSTNPFLDDSELIPQEPIYSSQQQSYHQASPSPPPPKSRNQQHMSAKEEKEQLRQRYMKEADVGNNNSNNRNMSPPPMASLGSALPPPSYEESTEYKSTSKPIYPVEKQRESSGEAVTRHRTHSSSSQPHRRHQQHGDDQYDDEYDNSHRPHRHHSGNERSHRHHHNSSHSNRHREGSTSSGSNKTKKDKRKSMAVISKNVDTIDKLDVTGLFGGSFHHDGPFDACTPHRNKNNKAAPVAAFPADGPNSTIGGATTKQSAMNEVFGVNDIDDDSFLYSTKHTASKDALRSSAANHIKNLDTKKVQQVHGVETSGLGSSTFLDGAPAVGTVSQPVGIQRGKTISYRSSEFSTQRNSQFGGYNNDSSNLRRNLSTNSRPTINRFNSSGSGNRQISRDELRYPRTHSAGVSQEDFRRNTSFNSNDNNDDDDVYLGNTGGVRFDSSAKKTSAGSKFLKRVKSLKVGSRKN